MLRVMIRDINLKKIFGFALTDVNALRILKENDFLNIPTMVSMVKLVLAILATDNAE
ncbi:hypothetical protein BgiBS90_012955, partial [Biomphalaria glabrata]